MMHTVKALSTNEEVISDATVSLQHVLFDSDSKIRKAVGKFDQSIEAYSFKDCAPGSLNQFRLMERNSFENEI